MVIWFFFFINIYSILLQNFLLLSFWHLQKLIQFIRNVQHSVDKNVLGQDNKWKLLKMKNTNDNFGNKFNENKIYQQGGLVQLVFFVMTRCWSEETKINIINFKVYFHIIKGWNLFSNSCVWWCLNYTQINE